MYTRLALTTALLAICATAVPLNPNATLARRDDTFQLHVWNNCKFQKEIGLYTITSDFKMVQKSEKVTIYPQGNDVFTAKFQDVGMRMTGHAEWDDGQLWTNREALFEFGYASWTAQDGSLVQGTAYDISMMQPVVDQDIGMGVWPIENNQGSAECEQKVCFPWDSPLPQGWTNPDQYLAGSPADTGCYKGKTDFKIVYCP